MKIDYKKIESDGKILIEMLSKSSTLLSEKVSEYRVLVHMKKEIESSIDLLKADLIEAEVNEIFPEDKEKVFVQQGAMQSVIDPISVYDEMVKRSRGREFFRVCSVSSKDLKKIDDGKVLVEMFKKETNRKASSLKISSMTKKELEESSK